MAVPRPSSTVPFTPRPAKRATSNRFGLTNQEYTKYASTLASVRRVPPVEIMEELEISGDSGTLTQFTMTAEKAETHRREPQDRDHHRQEDGSVRDRDRVDIENRPPSSARERPRSAFLPSARTKDREHRDSRPSSSASRVARPESVSRLETVRTSDIRTDSRPGSARERGERPNSIRDRPAERSEPTPKPKANQRQLEVEQESWEQLGENPDSLLDGVPLDVQEAWICEDLTFVLQGVEGALIRYAVNYDPQDADQRLQGVQWRVDPSLDPSLLKLVNRLLPLATLFTSVEASIELRNVPEYGMVSHALNSGIRSMLKEYRVLTAQLESLFLYSSTFTLQTLYFHLHPTLRTMSLLSSLCLSLETNEGSGETSDLSDDDDGLGGMAEELGLGGAGLKGLMKNLKAQEGFGGGGPVLGGEVLGILCEREATMSGDPTATTLHALLLQRASQPYARMLLRWITKGDLSDPYEEFMVKESGHITKGVIESDYTDEYWDRRYTLRDGSSLASGPKVHGKQTPSLTAVVPPPRQGTTRLPGGACIPTFLQPWKHKILLAGKYLNVMRECGIEINKVEEIEDKNEDVVMNEPKFYKRIEDAYIHANKTLLKLLVDEQELIPHLRSLKHYFFADQSDFLTSFLDLASNDLTRKAAKSVSIVKLQSLLDLAVRNPASSSSNDPYKDNLKVTMASQGLYDWLLKIVMHHATTEDGELDFGAGEPERPEGKETQPSSSSSSVLMGIDAVTFDYTVKFPLSLVISRKAVTRYQLIFRFLVHLHHLESGLSAMWLEHKTPAWRESLGNEDMDHWKVRLFALRARMTAFVRQMRAYATGEVLESNWRALEAKLANVGTVDQLMRDHVDFLDTCLKQCMLTNSKLLSVYAKLMKTMSAFVSYSESFNKVIARFRADPLGESDAGKANHRWTVLNKFEINFNHHTNLHLDAVTYHAGSENVALLALVTRLHQTTLRI